jgi:hypothetical protein
MAEEAKKHSIYVKKLKEIGSALGFDTKARKAENGYYREQYHLANPDCVWYVAVDRRLRDLGIFPDDAIPAVVFEVLYREEEKSMRGSMLSLPFRNPFRGVLVLLRREGETIEHYDDRKDYLTRLHKKVSCDNVLIWTEQVVDELHKKTVGKQ